MYNYIYLRHTNLTEKYCFFPLHINFCLNLYDFYLTDRLLLEEMLKFLTKKIPFKQQKYF